jgi:hypothetical protein
MSLGSKGLSELLPLCRTHVFTRATDPFSATDWSGQVVYLVRGQLLVKLLDGASRVLVGGHDLAAAPVARGGTAPRYSKAITDVELLSLEEDPLDIVVTWNQLATSRGLEKGVADQTDWRMMSSMFAVDNLTVGAFASCRRRTSRRCWESSSGFQPNAAIPLSGRATPVITTT